MKRKKKNQYPLPDHRDVKIEIEHVVKSSNLRTRVIYLMLAFNEMESKKIEEVCSMVCSYEFI